jgi:hypothetical protein
MITETGKNVLAKYLIGQTTSYASHIAIGCGARPIDATVPFADYSNKTELDFEMLRVPIISRGFVSEDGVPNIIFTAELPSEERYEITEVGVYSAAINQLAGVYDSKNLFAFTQTELWEHHKANPATANTLLYYPTPLSGTAEDNVIRTPGETAFQTNADNKIFLNADRVSRFEQARFLNNIVMIRGDDSFISRDEVSNQLFVEDAWEPTPGVVQSSNHIHLTGISLDFDQNAGTDEIRVAFSVANRVGYDPVFNNEEATDPDTVRLLIEFLSTEGGSILDIQSATIEIDIDANDPEINFSENRYFVSVTRLEDLIKSTNFSWSGVNVVKISASVIVDELPSSDYYVLIDAIRLENVTTVNPLYGLTGYSVIRSDGARPITKFANTANLVEFRFAIDVDTPVSEE